MIDFTVDTRFVEDLRDDVMVNEDLTLYELIGKDPVKAFYLGLNLNKWFSELDKKQQYLYSKQARHNKDAIEKYQSQLQFWAETYPSSEDEIDLKKFAEYVINNMFWDEDTEESDKIKLAFFFGNTIANNQDE